MSLTQDRAWLAHDGAVGDGLVPITHGTDAEPTPAAIALIRPMIGPALAVCLPVTSPHHGARTCVGDHRNVRARPVGSASEGSPGQ